MKIRFNHHDICFTIGTYTIHVSNIVFEQFKHPIPKHSHSRNSFELHYIPLGYGHAIVNEKQYDIIPNTLFVTGPFVEHEQIPSIDDPMYEYCIYLRLKSGTGSSEQDTFMTLFEQTTFWYGQDTQEIHSVMKQIFYELEHCNSGYLIQVKALLQQLIVKIIRNYEYKKETRFIAEPLNLADHKYLIIEECFLYEYQTMTLEKLASRLGLGIRQTERLLKKQYGKTFLQKRMEARMSAASVLLHNTAKSITEIAEEIGYSSVEHFSAAFKRFYGKSATEYRKDK